MTKTHGFTITVTYFVPIDKTDYGKRAAAYAQMDTITKAGVLPEGFGGLVLEIKAKEGKVELPDEPEPEPEPEPESSGKRPKPSPDNSSD